MCYPFRYFYLTQLPMDHETPDLIPHINGIHILLRKPYYFYKTLKNLDLSPYCKTYMIDGYLASEMLPIKIPYT